MKAFDLELAKQRKPIQTKHGWSARIICYDKASYDEYTILALVYNPQDEVEELHLYNKKGEDYSNKSFDLVMTPVKKEVWVNIFKNEVTGWYIPVVYKSKEDAERDGAIDKNFITTQKIEWDESI